jgi:nucleotide-binding universal stress UspA family protein
MSSLRTQPAIVVGVDGSAVALRAALWAVEEAVSRDIPLRLVYVVEDGNSELAVPAPKHADAEYFLRNVVRNVEATGEPVKIESDIVQGRPAATLVRLSRTAAMICVGVVGSNHFQHGHIGSTAAALAGSAHCPVAIIHGAVPGAGANANVVLVATDDSPDDGILLETAAHEASLRDAPLRAITCWDPPRSDPSATKRGDRQIRARLDRRLACWKGHYPGLQAEAVAVHGSLTSYLATHAADLQLLIISARGPGHVREVAGPAGNAALSAADCVVLVVDRQHL